ncbi:MAG: hypothetical protein KAG56_08605 [Sulfurovaceae bacterium]|nr:hypothetical protein [Sulfurovaceae bacterium]
MWEEPWLMVLIRLIFVTLLDSVKGYNKIILFANIDKDGFYEKLDFSKMTTAMAVFKNQDA